MRNYLNAGTGEPCAGQVNENILSILILNVPSDSDEVGNMGLEDPMGSAKPFESVDFGLKTGIRKNWAGQGMYKERVHKTNFFILRALCLLWEKMAVVSYLHLPFYPTTTQYV